MPELQRQISGLDDDLTGRATDIGQGLLTEGPIK